jgi:hypothetical protein
MFRAIDFLIPILRGDWDYSYPAFTTPMHRPSTSAVSMFWQV